MKTPQQIIDALPEGNRKRACLCLLENTRKEPERMEGFWKLIDSGSFSEASELIASCHEEKPHTTALYADMIWEG